MATTAPSGGATFNWSSFIDQLGNIATKMITAWGSTQAAPYSQQAAALQQEAAATQKETHTIMILGLGILAVLAFYMIRKQ